MLGNFSYCNPTKLYFGEDSLNYLNEELQKYGKNVVLVYGGGSIKKNGIYDEVIEILKKNGKNVAEIAGVMPNPTLAKLYEVLRSLRAIRRTCCWLSVEDLSATILRQYRFLSIVRKIRGKNILSVLRSRIVK